MTALYIRLSSHGSIPDNIAGLLRVSGHDLHTDSPGSGGGASVRNPALALSIKSKFYKNISNIFFDTQHSPRVVRTPSSSPWTTRSPSGEGSTGTSSCLLLGSVRSVSPSKRKSLLSVEVHFIPSSGRRPVTLAWLADFLPILPTSPSMTS